MNILKKALDRLPLRKRIIYVFSYSIEDALALAPPRPLPDGIEIREATASQLAAAAKISPRPDAAALFTRRYAAGRRCFIAWKDAQAIGYRWVSLSGVLENLEHTIPLRLEKTEGYTSDIYIAPDWRGSTVNRALGRTAFMAMRDAGLSRSMGVIISTNTPSLKSISRHGTLVAAVEQRRRPLKWTVECVRPVQREEADKIAAAFRTPATIRIDPGWLSARKDPLVLSYNPVQ